MSYTNMDIVITIAVERVRFFTLVSTLMVQIAQSPYMITTLWINR
jgi:hypothetical protein